MKYLKHRKTIILIIIGVILGSFVYQNFLKPAPVLFSLNDTETIYTITKDKKGMYRLNYKKEKDFKSAIVGKTNEALDQYLNMPIQTLGNFSYGTEQCIQQKCTKMNKGVVVNIDVIQGPSKKMYTSKELGVSFQIPYGWEVYEDEAKQQRDGNKVIYVGSPNALNCIKNNLNVTNGGKNCDEKITITTEKTETQFDPSIYRNNPHTKIDSVLIMLGTATAPEYTVTVYRAEDNTMEKRSPTFVEVHAQKKDTRYSLNLSQMRYKDQFDVITSTWEFIN